MAGSVWLADRDRVGNMAVLASVRNQQDRKAGSILANIDFLGELPKKRPSRSCTPFVAV